jgi:predicted PurR-regulated permease PerM
MGKLTTRARLVAVLVLLVLMSVVDSALYIVSLLADATLAAVAAYLLWPLFKAEEK